MVISRSGLISRFGPHAFAGLRQDQIRFPLMAAPRVFRAPQWGAIRRGENRLQPLLQGARSSAAPPPSTPATGAPAQAGLSPHLPQRGAGAFLLLMLYPPLQLLTGELASPTSSSRSSLGFYPDAQRGVLPGVPLGTAGNAGGHAGGPVGPRGPAPGAPEQI